MMGGTAPLDLWRSPQITTLGLRFGGSFHHQVYELGRELEEALELAAKYEVDTPELVSGSAVQNLKPLMIALFTK
jgi:hypothetical protein